MLSAQLQQVRTHAGLGVVLSSTEEVNHPDPEHGILPPQPILLVATSDDAIRLFTFGCQKRSANTITRPALRYEEAPYPVVAPPAMVVSTVVPSSPFWGTI